MQSLKAKATKIKIKKGSTRRMVHNDQEGDDED